MLQKTCYLLGKGNEKIRKIIQGGSGAVSVAEKLLYGYYVYTDGPEEAPAFPPAMVRDGWVLPETELFDLLTRKNESCTFIESCTGGLCAKKLTDIPGSSDIFWGGWIVYSNAAKEMLGVKRQSLEDYGAVSKNVVLELAERGRTLSGSDWGVAISGIAGPGGGSTEKPVGSVWIGISCNTRRGAYSFLFTGGRSMIREKAGAAAFILLRQWALQ